MPTESCTAFSGDRVLASGAPSVVVAAVKAAHDAGEAVLVFDDADARVVEFDLRGDPGDVLARLPSETVQKRGPGRPRLGVTAREVTLLPRHWAWLAAQPGGASVALRKLVENALRVADGPDQVRRSREAAYRFMTAAAGNRPGYEEATRGLFAGSKRAFDASVETWPADVSNYARRLAEGSWNNDQGGD